METRNAPASDFGEYLTNEYEILRRVFSYLSFYDLRNCLDVCIPWKEAAVVTFRERRRIQCLMLTDSLTKPSILSDAALAMSFCSLLTADGSKSHEMAEESLHFVAKFGIIALIEDSKPLLRRHRAELPLTPRSDLLAAVRFPKWDGVITKTISIGSNPMTNEEIDALIDLPKDVPIQAAIVILSDDGNGGMFDTCNDNLDILMTCLRNRKSDFAFGGCLLDVEVTSATHDNDQKGIKCVLFAGHNIEAASCVLDTHCRTSNEITAKVDELSKAVVHVENSVVLVFRCCDRQKVRRHYNYQPRENVETWEMNALKKFFPATPAIGCYGIGEFGWDCPELETAKKPRLRTAQKSLPDFRYGFSSVLMYLGFKK